MPHLCPSPASGRYPPLNLTPQRQKDLTIDALIRQALAYTATRSVLLVLEDLHWVDPTTLELVNRTIESIRDGRGSRANYFQAGFLPAMVRSFACNDVATRAVGA